MSAVLLASTIKGTLIDVTDVETDPIDSTGATGTSITTTHFAGVEQVFDSFGNVYVLVAAQSSAGPKTSLYVCADPIVGPGHTATCRVLPFQGFQILEFAAWGNVDFSTPGDVVDEVAPSDDELFLGPVVPDAVDRLVLTAFGWATGTSVLASIDSGFTINQQLTNPPIVFYPGHAAAWKVVSTTDPVSATWSIGGTARTIVGVMAVFATIVPPPEPIEDDLCASREEPILFASVASSEADREWYAVVDLPDRDEYYGGWKDDRLLSVSEIRRSLAGPDLDYQIGTFSAEFADDDYRIREYLITDPSKFYTRLEIEAYLISPSGRKVENIAALIATGLVDTDPEFDTRPQAMTVRLACRDRLGVAMGWTNTGQSQVPRRALNGTTLPGVSLLADGKAAWIPWGDLTTNQIVPSGFMPPEPFGIVQIGAFWQAGYAPGNPAVAPVTNVQATTLPGGNVPDITYEVQVFAVDAQNRTSSPEPFSEGYAGGGTPVTVVIPDQIIEVTWDPSPTAVRYFVVLKRLNNAVEQILETTATSIQFDSADPNGPTAGAVFPVPFFNYYAARAKEGPIVSAWHDTYDLSVPYYTPPNFPAIFAPSYQLPNGHVRPMWIKWIPNGASAYQVRKVHPGGFPPYVFNLLASSLDENGYLRFYEDWVDNDALSLAQLNERPTGRVQPMYTRDVVIPDGRAAKEFLLGGCAIKSVDDWYYDPDPNGEDPSVIQINQGDNTDFLFPADDTSWDSVIPNRYVDVIGTDNITRRFSFGYAFGEKGTLIASGISMLTVNMRGVESVGDSSGDLITDLHDQTQHLLNYFVVASGEGYTSGLWGPKPTQGLAGLPIVNAETFDAVKAMREGELAGGIVGCGVTGALGEFVDVSTELKRWMVSGDFRMGPNRQWQIVAHALNSSLSPLFITNELTDVYDIHNRTFKPIPKLSELQNLFTYRSSRDLIDTGWLVDNQVYANQESIDNWRIRKRGEDLNFNYIEAPTVVGHIFGKHVTRRANVPMYVTLEGGICLLGDEFDIGAYFNLKHWRGVADGGWEDRPMWVLSQTLDPATLRVRMECLDVTDLISTNDALLEGLMDIQLGGSWYNSPVIESDLETVDAFEYWDMRFPWSKFPDGTTLTARIWGAVPSGVIMRCHIYDPILDTIVATDPTVFSATSFELHTFAVPVASDDTTYRLRAVVSSGTDQAVNFKGMLRPDLP